MHTLTRTEFSFSREVTAGKLSKAEFEEETHRKKMTVFQLFGTLLTESPSSLRTTFRKPA